MISFSVRVWLNKHGRYVCDGRRRPANAQLPVIALPDPLGQRWLSGAPVSSASNSRAWRAQCGCADIPDTCHMPQAPQRTIGHYPLLRQRCMSALVGEGGHCVDGLTSNPSPGPTPGKERSGEARWVGPDA